TTRSPGGSSAPAASSGWPTPWSRERSPMRDRPARSRCSATRRLRSAPSRRAHGAPLSSSQPWSRRADTSSSPRCCQPGHSRFRRWLRSLASPPFWQELQPSLETDEAPQLLARVDLARQMARDQSRDERRRQKLPITRPWPQQQVSHVAAEMSAEPCPERDAESHLAARVDLGRHEIAEGVAQNRLAAAAPELESIRQARDVVDQLAIQKR